MEPTSGGDRSGVLLHWIPLGAGANVVRLSGQLFEAIGALVQRRERCDLYHSALEVGAPAGRYVIEMTPIRDDEGWRRGVAVEGPVGTRAAGRLRLFRYEIRRWRDGVIPDLAQAASSTWLTDDALVAARLLDLVPAVPALTWGRDEAGAGDMWNSNSVVSWLVSSAGIDARAIRPPELGRAPGWRAGLVMAARRRTPAPIGG